MRKFFLIKYKRSVNIPEKQCMAFIHGVLNTSSAENVKRPEHISILNTLLMNISASHHYSLLARDYITAFETSPVKDFFPLPPDERGAALSNHQGNPPISPIALLTIHLDPRLDNLR